MLSSHMLEVVTHFEDVVTSLNDVIWNICWNLPWYTRSVVVFMLPNRTWYHFIHSQGRGNEYLLLYRRLTSKFKVHAFSSRDLPYPWLYSHYQRDLCVYFPHNRGQRSQLWYNNYCNTNQWPSNSKSRANFSWLFISQGRFVLWEKSRCLEYFHIFEVKDHNDNIANTWMSTFVLQSRGNELFAWPLIFQARFVLSERSRCLFPHIRGQWSQLWYISNTAVFPWRSNSRSRAILRNLPYFRLGLCYRRDLGIYFNIFEVRDHNYDIINTAVFPLSSNSRQWRTKGFWRPGPRWP